jgi:Pyridoxamine 5'-phosphate oxidase
VPLVTWQTFEVDAPVLAAQARMELHEKPVALVGTVRKDGSPRISCVQPFVFEGELYLGMMWHSRKALDLLRDPRLTLRNAICTNAGNEVEVIVCGRATDVGDPETRRRFVDAVAERTPWTEPSFHLFAVGLESVAVLEYGGGEQHVRIWPGKIERRRRYA